MPPENHMRSIFAAFLFCFASFSFAQEPMPHPIDIWLQQALEKDYTTAGMRSAINKANTMWDKEMNHIYTTLMARLNKDQQASLKEAQRAWLKFRDSEGKVIAGIVSSKEGTMWQLTASNYSMELVRTRALQLKSYEDALEE
jgi:uncharacterized protein YecT (DUF1311 family)